MHPTDKNSAVCKVCDTKFKNSNKTALLAHKDSKKHQKNSLAKRSITQIQSFFKPKQDTVTLNDKIAKAEVLLAGFMAEHQMPYKQADHLTETLKVMFPECEVAQHMTMKRTKASYIIQEGIAHEERNEVAQICRKQKFSILIDECTDVSVSQVLAVVVRYFDVKTEEVVDALLDTVEVDDGSGEGLYKAVRILLEERGIPLTNIIGFGSDNCATMMGHNSGFQALLKKDLPSVFVLGCVCHSFALCSNYASKCLPSFLESFMKNVTSYFSRSSKRQNDFNLIQNAVKAADHQILKLSQTRWLSRGKVIERLLEQWDALKLYFQSEAITDKVDGPSGIYKVMTSEGTKHMLLFLNNILKKVDEMNTEFQTEAFRMHKLYKSICGVYRNILAMFIKDEVLDRENLSAIDPSDSKIYKDLKDIHLGGRCEAMLMTESLGKNESRFRSDCLKFLSELSCQIRKRFPLEEECHCSVALYGSTGSNKFSKTCEIHN